MMSTKLGTAKLYFTKEDLGKMLKLKDKDNLMVTGVEFDNVEGKVAITITTPMDNITNDRVKIPKGSARNRLSPELFLDNTNRYSTLSMTELYNECSKRKIGFTKDEINKFFNKGLDFRYGYDALRMFLEQKLGESELKDENEKYNLKIYEFLNYNKFKLTVNVECNIKKSYWVEGQENRLEEFVMDALSENDINIFREDGFEGIVVIDEDPIILLKFDNQYLTLMDMKDDIKSDFYRWS